MSRRFLELMAAAGLAPSMLEREQLRGQQAAQNANAISSAFGTSLNALTGAAFKAGDVMKADAQENADTVAKQALADNATSTGSHALLPGAEYGAQPGMEDPTSFAQTPGDLAKSAVDSNPALNAPKKTGDWVTDFAADPFGFKADAAAKAKATAQGGIANEVTASRDKAAAMARQQTLDEQSAVDRKATADKAAEDAAAKKQDEAAKALTSARADALTKARGMLTTGASQSDLDTLAKSVGLGSYRDLLNQADAAQQKENQGIASSAADIADKKAGANQKNAAAAKDYASIGAAQNKEKNKNASSLADVTDFKSAVDNASGTLDKIDGGHLKQVMRTQDLAKKLTEHGGIKGAIAGAIADQNFGSGDQTDEEATLFTQLAAIKAKSVKGLEGAHRTVSQHQIELVDGALGSLRTGNIEQAKKQLAALKQSANDTANAIGSEGTGAPTPNATTADLLTDMN